MFFSHGDLLCVVLALVGLVRALGDAEAVGFAPLLWNMTGKWKRANKEVYLITSSPKGKLERHQIRRHDENMFCTLPTLWQKAETVDAIKAGKKIGNMETMGTVYNNAILMELSNRSQHMVKGVYKLPLSKQNMVIAKLHDHILVTWRERDGHRKDQTGVAWLHCVPPANNNTLAGCNWSRSLSHPKQIGASGRVMFDAPKLTSETNAQALDRKLYGEDMRILRRVDGSLVANWCVNNVAGQFIQFFYAPMHVMHKKDNSSANELVVKAPIHRITMDRELPPGDQKNWPMFEYGDKSSSTKTLLFVESIQPLRIIVPQKAHALSPLTPKGATTRHVVDYGHSVSLTEATDFCWPWGAVRGGTPLYLINGEYLGFFHTKTTLGSRLVSTYVMGAYTLTAKPPFELKAMSRFPLMPRGLLFGEWTYPRMDFVLFPMSFEYDPTDGKKGTIYLSLGRNEREGWVVSLDYGALKASLRQVSSKVIAASQWKNGAPIPETFEYKAN